MPQTAIYSFRCNGFLTHYSNNHVILATFLIYGTHGRWTNKERTQSVGGGCHNMVTVQIPWDLLLHYTAYYGINEGTLIYIEFISSELKGAKNTVIFFWNRVNYQKPPLSLSIQETLIMVGLMVTYCFVLTECCLFLKSNVILNRVVLFEFHLKFWNTNSICIPVRSLL